MNLPDHFQLPTTLKRTALFIGISMTVAASTALQAQQQSGDV